jgi:hypothetical protein
MLSDVDARHRFFSAVASPDDKDHKEIAKVKSKINKIIA